MTKVNQVVLEANRVFILTHQVVLEVNQVVLEVNQVKKYQLVMMNLRGMFILLM